MHISAARRGRERRGRDAGVYVLCFGIYTILLLPIVYGVWHAHGRSEGGANTAQ